MEGIGLIIFLAVAFIFTLIVPKKVAQSIYVKTGYYGFATSRRIISVFLIIPLVLTFYPDNPLASAAFALIPIAIFVFMNRKAKKPAYIIVLTVLQIIYGCVWILFAIVAIVLKYGLGISSSNLSWDISEQMQAQFQEQEAQRQRQEQERLEQAEIYAQKQGFRDADDAELFGIDTGKYH